MESQKEAICKQLNTDDYKNLLTKILEIDLEEPKSIEKYEKAKSKANFMFEREKHSLGVHELMWKHSTESIAKAPVDSDTLAHAYSYRSKVLFHLREYKDSIRDIDKALQLNKMDSLKVELLCRKTVCSVAACLGLERNTFEKAKFCLNKIDDTEENKNKLTELLQQAEAIMEKPQTDIQDKESREKLYPDIDYIKIAYSEKFGRHLKASKNIKPGEIIVVEKFFAASHGFKENFKYCSHCLTCTWAMIPCDYCDSNVYCSESCKKKAWNKYHDMECSVSSLVNLAQSFFCNSHFVKIMDNHVHMGLKLTIMALKEAKTIQNLKEEIIEIDSYEDNLLRGMTNGKFRNNTYKSIYSLSIPTVFDKLDELIMGSTLTLIALAKQSNIFGENFKFSEAKDLINNEDVIFIGALLLKFASISSVNSTEFLGKVYNYNKNKANDTFIRGIVISSFSSLINHSCNPNVNKIYTNDGKIAYFSVLPIDKNGQIFDNYGATFFCDITKSERRKYLMDKYQFRCYCEACEQNWTDNIITDCSRCFKTNHKKLNPLIRKYSGYMEILMNLKSLTWNLSTIDSIAGDIKKLKKSTKPNEEVLFLAILLYHAFFKTYGNVELTISEKCKKTKV